MQSKRPRFNPLILALALAAVLMVWSVLGGTGAASSSSMEYSTVVHYFESLQVTQFSLDLNTGVITMNLKEGGKNNLPLPDTTSQSTTQATGGLLSGMLSSSDEDTAAQKNSDGTVTVRYKLPYASMFVKYVGDYIAAYDEANPDAPMVYDYTPVKENIPWMEILFYLAMLGCTGFLLFSMMRGGAGGGGIMNVGKAKVKDEHENQKTATFADVAGEDEEKEELKEVVEFLKSPEKFNTLGARIPHGVLLVGPPGTGKTLLARACAGEAGVPFYSISGSDFVEMYVGVGASRVRDLFDKAKKSMPCIIFIDEIDAVGRQRGAGLGGGHDEREQTLNQLLVDMDGFESNEGVILISATNRPDVLDPALLRPGRFDRQVVVSTPDRPGRKQILIVHTKKTPIGKDVDLDVIARATPGFSGAELENLVNEAALQAAKLNKNEVNMSDFEFAKDKIFMGRERRSLILSDEEKRITAYHEGGHALTAKLLPGSDPVHKVSIVPRGRALGITMQLPGEDRHGYSRNFLRNNLVILLGGRVAEEIIFKDVTTGASNDIERVTKLARKMVTEWGMSDAIGTLTIGETGEEVFIGREWVQNKNYSEDTARLVDAEVKRIVEEAHERCTKLLTENIDKLHRIAEALIERETISGEELDMLIEGKPLPPAEEHPASGKSGPKDGGTPSGSGADFAFEKPGDQEQAPEDGARPSGEDKGRNAGEPSADTSGPNQEQDEKK